jgi:hypothetical protein
VTASYREFKRGRKSHIPPDFVADGAPQRVRAAHALMSL